MAQQFPTSAQVIYDTLAADATFMSLLGTYDFRGGGGTLPAISIVSSGQSLPAVRNVQGVECVIQDAGDTEQFNYLTDDSDIRTKWRVFIISWEPSTGADLQAAVNRVCRRFANSSSMETVAASDGAGALVQTMITIMSHMPILAP